MQRPSASRASPGGSIRRSPTAVSPWADRPVSPVASHACRHYIGRAGLRGASGAISPGPYRSSRELSLTGLVGSDIWRPPTFVGNPGSTLRRPLRLRTHSSMAQSTSIEDAKAELRRQARARRDALPADVRAAAAQAIAERRFPVAITQQTIVSGFMPIGSEINPIPLMRKLAGSGAQLALPAVAGRGKPLIMRAFAFGQRLVAGTWGIREPAAEAAEVFPDILL